MKRNSKKQANKDVKLKLDTARVRELSVDNLATVAGGAALCGSKPHP